LYGDSEIKSNLVRFADQSCCELDEVESFGRAILLPRFDADRYVDQALSGKHKKNLDHKLKGLRELGDVNFQVSYDSLGLSEWLEQFISLEHSGWKSRNGGSLRSSPLEERFFHDLVTCGSKSERIIRQTMTLSQKPIVKRVVLSSGTKTFAFKTAYDEQWSKWSPGMLMELKNLSWALEQETKITMESCAAPNAELFRRLWLDTCTISSLMLSKQRSTGRIIVSAIAGLRQLKRRGVNLGAHIKPKIHL
jgi:CelD/BcsL family acetyltransferase involved in cellulose biosynthesis